MQLNPARGRKLKRPYGKGRSYAKVYAAQPREGTETVLPVSQTRHQRMLGLCSSTPRGDGNSDGSAANCAHKSRGLCSSTPRGDGNTISALVLGFPFSVRFMQLNPARGRKLVAHLARQSALVPRFMQLNPARGRKHLNIENFLPRSIGLRFMQLNPARGRKR